MAGATLFAVMVSDDTPVASEVATRVVFGVGMVACWGLLLIHEGTTNAQILGRGLEAYKRILMATAKLLALMAAFILVLGVPVPRQTLLVALATGLVGCVALQVVGTIDIRLRRVRHGEATTRVLVVGDPAATDRMSLALTINPRSGYIPIPSAMETTGRAGGITALRDPGEIVEAARTAGAEYVILAGHDPLNDEWLRVLRYGLRDVSIGLMLAPQALGLAKPKVTLEQMGDLPLLYVDDPGYSRTNWGKIAFDRLGSLLGLIVLSPLFLVTAVAIRIGDHGPVFYRPTRVGRDGTPFRMWKFRSMYPDADKRWAEMTAAAGGGNAFFKMRDDPRITPVGRFLRRTSLDELPQLINVLSGSMSLVGPRPLVDGEGRSFPGFVERRELVKPGMTGLWQVSGRSDTDEADRVELDLYYVENWSLEQDLRIMLRTAVTVARGDGAY